MCWANTCTCGLSPHAHLGAGHAAQEDLSPPRKRSRGAADPVSDPARPGGPHKPRFMPDGGRAGKVTGAELAAELQAKKQRDAKEFASLGQQLTGHGAETVRNVLMCVLKLKRVDAGQTSHKSLQHLFFTPTSSLCEWCGQLYVYPATWVRSCLGCIG